MPETPSMKLRSGLSSPSSCSSLWNLVCLPLIVSLSIFSSKCLSWSYLILGFVSSFISSSFVTAGALVFFSPRAAALEDLSLGVVATRCALLKSIISLKHSKSTKLSSKSIIYSSISSFLCSTIDKKLSILKPSIYSVSFYNNQLEYLSYLSDICLDDLVIFLENVSIN
jgi:hypothetical protein